MKYIARILIPLFLISCSSTTVIRTTDPEAKIYVDDQFLGKGSVVHTDMKVSWSDTRIKVKKDGCKSENYVMTKDEELDVPALIFGVLTIVPILWVLKYKGLHNYEYQCQEVN